MERLSLCGLGAGEGIIPIFFVNVEVSRVLQGATELVNRKLEGPKKKCNSHHMDKT